MALTLPQKLEYARTRCGTRYVGAIGGLGYPRATMLQLLLLLEPQVLEEDAPWIDVLLQAEKGERDGDG